MRIAQIFVYSPPKLLIIKFFHNDLFGLLILFIFVSTYVKLLNVKGIHNGNAYANKLFAVVITYVKLLKKLLSKSFFVKEMFWVKVLFTELKTRNRLVSPHAIQRFVTNVK